MGGVAVVLVVVWAAVARLAEPDCRPASTRRPSHCPTRQPGTVIRSEPLAACSNGAAVTRVLYMSTGLDDKPIAVSGIVVTPPGTPPAGGWTIVAWAHGTTGIVPRCAPSLESDGGTGKIPEVEQLIAEGHVVVATDYPGLGTPGIHPYLVGESEGRAVLDSIRSARSLLAGKTSDTAAIFGHSQGGHATLFAGACVPTYAPELKIVGIAPMSPPTALGELLARDIHEPPGIVLTSYAVESWAVVYPGLSLDDIVHVGARTATKQLSRQCATPDALQDVADLPDVLALEGAVPFGKPRGRAGLEHTSRRELTVTHPRDSDARAHLAGRDRHARTPRRHAELLRRAVQGRRRRSSSTRTRASGTSTSVRSRAPHILPWIEDRFAGKPVVQGCATKTVQP